ncbi:purine nucleoside permease [Kockovaella imperatae]|uniref:Purine nucleoside permease n=1 Tax=Kockovaella imperatae TaxID=4999 RepID=A0A1Y1UNQ4_9TREE|nr:purine nucleoside permease [Kockovaella imperatae]ORX39096.1 purine nucleoside permease [Kockovaella imperatae]
MIVSMFGPESIWSEPLQLDQNVTVTGLSPLYPEVHCDSNGTICQFVTGEAEINAACSMTALLLSHKFDFRKTYFMIAGIAGINPFEGTLGSVGLAQFAVQVALAYELDARQIPSNWTTGYWLQGTNQPGDPPNPDDIYGTEVFELNTNLRQKAFEFTKGVELNDTASAAAYRARFNYAPANQPPSVFFGDVATSDVYFAGSDLAEAFGNITLQWTNNTGHYALTAQEDNASFEAMVRADRAGLMDFSRVILMRTASDFDRAPPNLTELYAFEYNQGGFPPSIANILIAGQPIVEGIIANWDSEFEQGIAPQANWSYNADDLHTLAQKKMAATRRRMTTVPLY